MQFSKLALRSRLDAFSGVAGGAWMGIGLLAFVFASCASGGSRTPDTGASRQSTLRVNSAVGSTTIDVDTDSQSRDTYVLRPRAQLWPLLPAALEQLGIEVGYSDPATFTMGNAGIEVRRIEGKRLSTWLDCGYGTTAQANADTYTVNLSLMITLGDVEQTGTQVTTRMEASAKPRAHSGHPVICTSKQRLEVRVAELLAELAGSAGE